MVQPGIFPSDRKQFIRIGIGEVCLFEQVKVVLLSIRSSKCVGTELVGDISRC